MNFLVYARNVVALIRLASGKNFLVKIPSQIPAMLNKSHLLSPYVTVDIIAIG